MTPGHTKKGSRRYRYYHCSRGCKEGMDACPARASLPAGEIERFVAGQIAKLGQDPFLIAESLAETATLAEESIQSLKAQRRALCADLANTGQSMCQLNGDSEAVKRLIVLQESIGQAQQRVGEIDDEISALQRQLVTQAEIDTALDGFESLWDKLKPIDHDPLTLRGRERQTLGLSANLGFAGLLGDGP